MKKIILTLALSACAVDSPTTSEVESHATTCISDPIASGDGDVLPCSPPPPVYWSENSARTSTTNRAQELYLVLSNHVWFELSCSAAPRENLDWECTLRFDAPGRVVVIDCTFGVDGSAFCIDIAPS